MHKVVIICVVWYDGQIDPVVDGPFNSNKKQRGSKAQKCTIIFTDANDKNNWHVHDIFLSTRGILASYPERNFGFLQDGASAHSATAIRATSPAGRQQLLWSPHSSNLNPLD